jgi:hypothetical protein
MFRGKVYSLLARGTSTKPLVSIETPDKWGYSPPTLRPVAIALALFFDIS